MFDHSSSEIKIASLFSGCGGLDHGFEEAGFRIHFAADQNADAVECYNSSLRPVARQLTIDRYLEFAFQPDVIIAGPPCQGFSTGGGYKANDERNDLLISTCSIIARCKPRLAVIENVEALTNRRNTGYLSAALEALASAGYHCEWSVLTATDFGVAQRRRRTVIIARKSAPFTMYRASPREAVKLSSVLSGISDSDINHKPIYHSADLKHHRIALRIKPGQKLCNVRSGPNSVPTWEIPEVFGSTNGAEKLVLQAVRQLRRTERKRSYGDADPVSVDRLSTICSSADAQTIDNLRRIGYLRILGNEIDLTNTFNGKYRRLRADDVSPTVDTRFGDIQLFLHPLEHRGMTVREAARIQGFPDNIKFPKNEKSAFRLIGNAVPPPMAFELAKYCRELL